MRRPLLVRVVAAAFVLLPQTLAVPIAHASAPQDVYRVTIFTQGRGTVLVRPARVRCPPRCEVSFRSHARAVFSATPAKGWRFVRWSYYCRGTKPTCAVDVGDGFSVVMARFVRS
jgi:hypothetical protein